MAKRLWAKMSYETAKIVVTFGFIIGALPVKWNNVDKMLEPLVLRKELLRWICAVIFIGFWQLVISLRFGRAIATVKNVFQFFADDPIRVLAGFGSVLGICLQLHTAWKYKEFTSFINKASLFYENFQGKYANKQERRKPYVKEDTISGIMKMCFMLFTLFFSTCAVIAYLLQCQRHVLNYAFPVCDFGYPPYTKIPIKVLGSVFQFYFASHVLASLLLYVDLFAAVVLMGLYMIGEMREMPLTHRRTKLLLLKPKHWFRCYCSLELMVKHLNDCIGQIFMPVHMITIVTMTAMIINALVRYSLDAMVRLGAIVMLCMILLYYVFLIGRGSYFSSTSSERLQSIKSNLKSPYFVKKHAACRVLKPAVGAFFPLKQQTVATMYQSSVELTCNMLVSQIL